MLNAEQEVWASADLHYGHKKVIAFCTRPYVGLEAMVEDITAKWNSVVKPNDIAYILGDVAWTTASLQAINRLNGKLHLILGNHDCEKRMRKFDRWESVQHYARIKYGDKRFILSHCPFEVWPGQEKGSIHLHGHTHNNRSHIATKKTRRFDVGVDCHNMYPVSLASIIERVKREEMQVSLFNYM